MNEYLVLFLALGAVGVFFLAKGIWEDKKSQKAFIRSLEQTFGTAPSREYKEGEWDSLSQYLKCHPAGFQIDEITWEDLGMDLVFADMNQTQSAAGQEYLYYLLHTPVQTEAEFGNMEAQIAWLGEQAEERKKMQLILHKIGRTNKYSIYEYLDFLNRLGNRNYGKVLLMNLAVLLSLLGFLVNAGVGVLCLISVCCFNIGTYLKDKREIEPFLVSFQYIFRMLAGAERLCKVEAPVFAQEQDRLRKLGSAFGKMKRSARWGMRTMDGSGNPLEVLFAYINMIFHWDILAFSVMLNQLLDKKQEVDEMVSCVGRIDAMIAVASYRRYLGSWCVPQLTQEKSALEIRNLYHPLLSEPVKNSIRAEKGVLLTGSNASGKSTFLKAAAISALLAQTIHTCPADRYEGRYYRIFSSMALRDNISGGESYYIVEIKALKRVLDAAKEEGNPILCFVDEVLRGTNTVERIAAGAQILKSLHRPDLVCFAATHDIELTDLLEGEYDNYHFEEEIRDGDIVFPYELLQGKAATRNAIRLLSMMGYEESLTEEAENMAARFLQSGVWSLQQETERGK